MFDIEEFNALSDVEKELLGLLSVIYKPVAVTPFINCATKAKIFHPHMHKPFTGQSMRHALKRLYTSWVRLSENRYACKPEFIEHIALEVLKSGNFERYANLVRECFPSQNIFGEHDWKTPDAAIAELRIALYKNEPAEVYRLIDSIYNNYSHRTYFSDRHPYLIILGVPANLTILEHLGDELFLDIASYYLSLGLASFEHSNDIWEYTLERIQRTPLTPQLQLHLNNYTTVFATQSLLRAEPVTFPAKPENSIYLEAVWHSMTAALQVLQCNPEQAFTEYNTGLKLLRKAGQRGKYLYFEHFLEIFYVVALMLSDNPEHKRQFRQFLQDRPEYSPNSSDMTYNVLAAYEDGVKVGRYEAPYPDDIIVDQVPALLFTLLAHYWLGKKASSTLLEGAKFQVKTFEDLGYYWLAAEHAQALAYLLPDSQQEERQTYAEKAQHWHDQGQTQSLFDWVTPEYEWERSLKALNQLAGVAEPEVENTDKTERIVWLLHEDSIDVDESGQMVAYSRAKASTVSIYSLAPKIQKRNKSGGWTKGRAIAFKRLVKEREMFSFLSLGDRKICDAIESEFPPEYYYNSSNYTLNMQKAWPNLIGHPRVYWSKSLTTPLEILEGEAELLVSEEGENVRVNLYPSFTAYHEVNNDPCFISKETPTRLRVFTLDEPLFRLRGIIGDGLVIPRAAEPHLRTTLGSLAPMIRIQSDLEGIDEAEAMDTDSRIHINLLPFGDGLRLTLRVQPFGEYGPLFPPGQGRVNLLTEKEGVKVKTRRDLEQEKENSDKLMQTSSVLGEWESVHDDLVLEEPEDCLEVLDQLHAQGDEVILAWPEGEVMKITRHFNAGNMRLNIAQEGDWFELDGEVDVSEHLVLSLRQLLDLSAESKGRFLPLGDGQFLTLTNNFRKKLDALDSYSNKKGDKTRINGLASLALEDFMDEVGELNADDAWKKQVEKLKTIRNTKPRLPKTLQTELRDYQREGFTWLHRLAEWGVGACLADDMGLGKTIQALALLLKRANKGPALVVAPTSVANNWLSETQKFAPTLKPVMYGHNPIKKREELVHQAAKFDLVICSYGLLQQDGDTFMDKHWSTIILDEAQAIKNISAKRTRVAHKMSADFKLITTGTPIENHLGELWSLFRFLNAGLLGSQDQFMKRFIAPIERLKDRDARQNLKRLIQPFILRRTKTQVLDELPSRTEITLEVPLSADERALYEAMRQQAMDTLAEGVGDNQHLQVLAQITRLRLASCHPQLVMPESKLPGSKLQRFAHIVEDLVESNHKALVFSQFVKHLAILRRWLDEHKISYQYLDGSTPSAKRKDAVDAFQNGEGDVFLISLKAGGSGLNLTAADYVIHMDPWWNPAVEDQASDRAHRIGQQRPVTIYRLVAENTIEEKIVKLHQHKRDLADSLLEGSDMSGKMSTKDMLQLIRDA